jgi:hypothetical protein
MGQENLRCLFEKLPDGMREKEPESHQRRGKNNDWQMT